MPNNYLFLDSDGSILTAESSIISGSVHRPIVTVASFLSTVPTSASGNQSVSGTVGSSVIGMLPSGTQVLGSVATLQGTNPWITTFSNSSILATQQGTVIVSVVSSNPSSLLTGSSIFGMLPAGTQVIGSVAVLQGTSPWNIAGSVLAVQGTWSGSVLATISGTPNVNAAGSVVAFQGTNPWVMGSVLANVGGSVLSQQLGTRISSVVGSIPSSLLTGVHGHRNDAVASFLGGNLTWNPIATDSAGRIIIKPFSSDDGTIIDYSGSVVSTSVTLIRASTIGMRNYITDFFVANTGATTTRVTFLDGSTSVLGHTIAPTASGSNAPGITVPLRSARSQDLTYQVISNTSVLYMTVKGYQAP